MPHLEHMFYPLNFLTRVTVPFDIKSTLQHWLKQNMVMNLSEALKKPCPLRESADFNEARLIIL